MRTSGIRSLSVVLAAALLQACGTGGLQSTTTPGGGGGGGGGGPVTQVALVPSSTQLLSTADGSAGGAAGVTLTAIALDASNNVVASAPISFSACVPDGTATCPGSVTARTGTTPAAGLLPAGTQTAANGTLTATLSTGGNPNLGTILVTAKSGNTASAPSAQVLITVVSPPPASGGGGSTNTVVTTFLNNAVSSHQLASDATTTAQGVTVTAFTTDSNHNAIAGVPVSFTASSGLLTVVNGTSDSSGQAVAILTTGGDSSARCIDIGVSAPNSATTTVSGTPALTCASSNGVNVVSTSSGTPTPSSLTLLASSPNLSSSASTVTNGVTLTALVKDANNNVIAGVPVSFSTPNSAAITVTQGTTDANGLATATLTTGGDPTNRVINITATTSNGVSNVTALTVNVVGTTLTVSGPSNTQSGVATSYTAVLLDSGGSPIANKVVQFTYTGGTATLSPANGQVTTNSSGQAPISVTPTGSATSTTLSGSALSGTATGSTAISISTDCFQFTAPAANLQVPLNTTQAVTVSWKTGGCSGSNIADGTTINFSSTRGTFSASSMTTTSGTATVNISATQAGFATITASSNAGNKPTASVQIEFVATVPNSVNVQASPGTIATNQQSTITATVLDASNNLVNNATVQFALTDNTGGTLSAGSATTNSQGKAQVTYNASSTPSSANGVSITATVTAVGGTPVTNKSGTTTLTVGGAALHITLGTGNTISKENDTTYVMPWYIAVTDSGGNPAPTAQVSLSVHALIYRKGTSQYNSLAGLWVRTDGAGGSPIDCTNEDLLTGNSTYDLNGTIDPGEDLNGDGTLQPGGVVQVPLTVTLDANGAATFQVRYPMDTAYWDRVRLRATATVAGSDSVAQVFFDLPGLSTDFSSSGTSPPGFDSPYGTLQDCSHEQIANFTSSAQGAAAGSTVKAFVSLSQPAGNNPISIPFTLTNAGETQNTNFTVTSPASCTTSSCTLTIAAGSSSAEIDVAVATPATDGDQVILTLGSPTSQAILGSNITHTIVLNGAAVSFASSGETTTQGAGAQGITVKLDRAAGSTITVPYTLSGSAVSPADYSDTSATPGSVTFNAGETVKSISITPAVSGSTTDKTVVITLGAPTGPGAVGSPSTNTLVISGQ